MSLGYKLCLVRDGSFTFGGGRGCKGEYVHNKILALKSKRKEGVAVKIYHDVPCLCGKRGDKNGNGGYGVLGGAFQIFTFQGKKAWNKSDECTLICLVKVDGHILIRKSRTLGCNAENEIAQGIGEEKVIVEELSLSIESEKS